MTKAAIYARYSTTLQDARSVEDQVRLCRERAAKEGWEVDDGAVFADYAISGSVRQRPALNAMLERAGEFDFLLSEAIDRISRHQADIASIYETLMFNDCQLVTLSEGEVSELHIGLKGTMAALFRKDLADKIRRGQSGRVNAGRIPGGLCYGYRKVIKLAPNGEPELGLREIDQDQAAVIRRIYAEFIAGISPRRIAKQLNAEGIPSPSGKQWAVSAINGDRIRRNGILQNEIYVGRLVYGRTKMVRDPVTRKRVAKVRPESEWQVQEVPDLRIVSDEEWEAVRSRRHTASNWTYAMHRRPKRLLSGLLECGECGGSYVVIGSDKWGCVSARTKGTCSNRRTIETASLERRVLAAVQTHLMAAEPVRLFVREYHRQYAQAMSASASNKAKVERELEVIQRKVDRLVEAVSSGDQAVPEIMDALVKARSERAAAEADLERLTSMDVIALHPNIAETYRENVERLTTALAEDPNASLDAVPTVRSLIDRVVLTPREEGRGVDIDVFGQIASIIAMATGKKLETGGEQERMFSMVAEEGLEPPTPGL